MAPAGFPPPGAFVQPGTRMTSSGVPLAGWGIRFGGFLIDGVLLYIVQIILGAVLHRTHALRVTFAMTQSNGTVRHNSISLLVVILAGILFLIYGGVMIGSRGQTLGMMAVGIKAVSDPDGGPVGMGRAFGRAVVQILLSYTVVVGLISDLFPLWDAKRQTLQDKAVSTVVVRSRNAG